MRLITRICGRDPCRLELEQQRPANAALLRAWITRAGGRVGDDRDDGTTLKIGSGYQECADKAKNGYLSMHLWSASNAGVMVMLL
jgi:hypothetical protein